MKKKEPDNCPYCEAEEKGYSSAWTGSEEFFKELKEKHIKEHCDECPYCGQKINPNIKQ